MALRIFKATESIEALAYIAECHAKGLRIEAVIDFGRTLILSK